MASYRSCCAGAAARTRWDHLRSLSTHPDNPAPSGPHQGKQSRHVGGPGRGHPDGTPSPQPLLAFSSQTSVAWSAE